MKTEFEPTQKSMSQHLGISETGLSLMKKSRPKLFALVWDGWLNKCREEMRK